MIDIQVHPWIMFILNCAGTIVCLSMAYLAVRGAEWSIPYRHILFPDADGTFGYLFWLAMLFILALLALAGAITSAVTARDWAVKAWRG